MHLPTTPRYVDNEKVSKKTFGFDKTTVIENSDNFEGYSKASMIT